MGSKKGKKLSEKLKKKVLQISPEVRDNILNKWLQYCRRVHWHKLKLVRKALKAIGFPSFECKLKFNNTFRRESRMPKRNMLFQKLENVREDAAFTIFSTIKDEKTNKLKEIKVCPPELDPTSDLKLFKKNQEDWQALFTGFVSKKLRYDFGSDQLPEIPDNQYGQLQFYATFARGWPQTMIFIPSADVFEKLVLKAALTEPNK